MINNNKTRHAVNYININDLETAFKEMQDAMFQIMHCLPCLMMKSLPAQN